MSAFRLSNLNFKPTLDFFRYLGYCRKHMAKIFHGLSSILRARVMVERNHVIFRQQHKNFRKTKHGQFTMHLSKGIRFAQQNMLHAGLFFHVWVGIPLEWLVRWIQDSIKWIVFIYIFICAKRKKKNAPNNCTSCTSTPTLC
jgi:hypothetical protein